MSSSTWAQRADALQIHAGQGPSEQAFQFGATISSIDTTADPRWPRLRTITRRAERPARGCTAAALAVVPAAPLGVLTLYAASPGAITDGWQPFAARATALIREAFRLADSERTVEQLTQALQSRAVIDQAKGIVMAQQGCNADEAFRWLSHQSGRAHRKVRDVAQDIVAAVAQGLGHLSDPHLPPATSHTADRPLVPTHSKRYSNP